jgi:hypothetical protein
MSFTVLKPKVLCWQRDKSEPVPSIFFSSLVQPWMHLAPNPALAGETRRRRASRKRVAMVEMTTLPLLEVVTAVVEWVGGFETG